MQDLQAIFWCFFVEEGTPPSNPFHKNNPLYVSFQHASQNNPGIPGIHNKLASFASDVSSMGVVFFYFSPLDSYFNGFKCF
jgi:hypothetical protein